MKECCPPGRGCNAPSGDEPCALSLCQRAASEEGDAALAVERWTAWQQACRRHLAGTERRFRRRAFQRARDRALMKLALRGRRRGPGRRQAAA